MYVRTVTYTRPDTSAEFWINLPEVKGPMDEFHFREQALNKVITHTQTTSEDGLTTTTFTAFSTQQDMIDHIASYNASVINTLETRVTYCADHNHTFTITDDQT